MDRSHNIFGNELPLHVIRKTERSCKKKQVRYGAAVGRTYHLAARPAPAIGSLLGVQQLILSDTPQAVFDDKSVIIGSIRMGFGHYRISMALASAAHALDYTPYWFDLHSFSEAPCGKIIQEQNKLYSFGSRLSQKDALFNRFFWEPLNSEGFRQLSYNSGDQKTAELMTGVYADLPKDIPFAAAHVWPAQAAVHAGLTHVVNAIPDNWPMGLHLAEGAIHTAQTPSAALGYRALRGMNKKRPLRPMPKDTVFCTGHYIDHELVSNIPADCEKRIRRMQTHQPKRWLLSVGGAGAQQELFALVTRKLLPAIRRGRAVLLINTGDHLDVWHRLLQAVPEMKDLLHEHFDDFNETVQFCRAAYDGEISGIHAFCHSDIFAAVYSRNLLMRICDVLVTKPSELAFYPVPKLLVRRVGGHEAWGAVCAAEIGDGTYECMTPQETTAMLVMMQRNGEIIEEMCRRILLADQIGTYSGAYEVIRLACRKA